MESAIIGRRAEKALFHKLLDSHRPEFLALYGRRRVGKTFLVSEFFQDKGLYFEMAGSKDTRDEVHLARFCAELSYKFTGGKQRFEAESREKAFTDLRSAVDLAMVSQPSQKIILFFDEVPWIDKNGTGFLGALDYHWNRYFSKTRYANLILIISGSAASWIIRKVINSKGGLHNRITHIIRLIPFTLRETEEYLLSRGINFDRGQLLELFICIGGIPFYLSLIEKSESVRQAINRLCFQKDGFLIGEFERLFSSLFENHLYQVRIIRALASTKKALTRNEVLARATLPNNGDITIAMHELAEAGFIIAASPFGKKKKQSLYRIIDEYSVFYLSWIEPVKSKIVNASDQNYWLQMSASSSWNAWAGYAFEGICLKHISKIKEALGISGVLTYESSWRSPAGRGDRGPRTQIDLVIDRADRTINLCEIKYANNEFVISREYAQTLKQRKISFQQATRTRKSLFQTMISTYGVKENDFSFACIDNQIAMDVLF